MATSTTLIVNMMQNYLLGIRLFFTKIYEIFLPQSVEMVKNHEVFLFSFKTDLFSLMI